MRKIVTALFLLCVHWAARGQAQYNYRYWFDGDESTGRAGTSATPAWRMDIGLEGLGHNFHTLHFQVGKGAEWSVPITRYFMKLPGQGEQRFAYWFDNHGDEQQYITPEDGAAILDLSGLADGFHVLQATALGDASSSSVPMSRPFIKVPQTEGVDYLTCVLLVDNKVYKQEKVRPSGAMLRWEVDASGIPQGLHKAQVLVLTPSGSATNAQESFFYRAITSQEKETTLCYYSVDGDKHMTQAGRLEGDIYHFNLDVAKISDGFHRLSYMLMTQNGASSQVLTSFFYKIPLGGNGVVQYDYWVNDNEEQMRVTKLEERKDTFKLVDLLDVESCPIRSSCFHFEVKDRKPTVYARNDLHMRFLDVAGGITEAVEQFVDYRVSREVTEVEPLEGAEGQKNRKKPEKDDILWYSVEASIGDSLAIRSGKAATVQIFDPDGEEVYAASGAESVAFGGCHAYKNGTYYVALHDVTASGISYVALDYQHIDKYAVLSHTPGEIGAAVGYFHAKLLGNGFDKLKSAAFVNGSERITADSIAVGSISNATLECHIDRQSVPLGDYDLVMEFEEDGVTKELTVEKALKIVEPIFGNIEIEVKPQPRTAKPYPVTVTVRNAGNVSYQMVPLYMGFDHPELIDEVSALNFTVCAEETAEGAGNATLLQTDNLLGMGINGFVLPTLIPSLEAGATMDLLVGFVAGPHTNFNLYAWSYQPWSMKASAVAAAIDGDTTVCEVDPCEIALQVIPDHADCVCGTDWGSIALLAGTTPARYNYWTRRTDSIAFDEGHRTSDASDGDVIPLRAPADIMQTVMERCAHLPADTLEMLRTALLRATEDGCARPEPKPIDILMPGDPNDMKGYQAPSGSKYVGKGVTDAYYTIEFENDPELANASAHHIVVVDTLNGTYIDLASFAPTGIKISNKDTRLDGKEQSFVKTIDMRPEINALAEVTLQYDAKTGIARWDIRSLDPMTMEYTDHAMKGVLPVNHDGDGQGELTFDIKLKADLPDSARISNRATIIFDNEAAIVTPTWTNIVDTIAPKSSVAAYEKMDDNTVVVHFEASDNSSGIWKYDLYAQEKAEAPWIKVGADLSDSYYKFERPGGIDYGFCVVATDSAGNVEPKVLRSEKPKAVYKTGDVNDDGEIDETDATLAIGKYLGREAPTPINEAAADVNKDGLVDALDVSLIRQMFLPPASRRVASPNAEPEQITTE